MTKPLPTLLGSRLAAPCAMAGGFLVAAVWLTGETGPGGPSNFVPFLRVLVAEGSIAILWWLAAVGAGLVLTRSGAGARSPAPLDLDRLAAGTAVGAALILALVSLLATVGLLGAGRGVVAWTPLLAGGAALLWHVRNEPWQAAGTADGGVTATAGMEPGPLSHPFRMIAATLAGVAAALLLVAASAAPGWLWASEFGGYDAQSYHLVLAKAWSVEGRAAGPIDGNVYSALPSFVECVFAQLMLLRGDPIAGSIACQWWVAFATIAMSFCVWRLGYRVAGAAGGACAALVAMATPWIVVVGTLAYNDVMPCLFLAGGWLVAVDRLQPGAAPRTRDAALMALVAAAAVGAKPTAALMAALPLVAVVVLRCGWKPVARSPLALSVAVAIPAAALAPWLVRNAIAHGNPVFPFAASVFGHGPWTEEQTRIFLAAHGPGVGIAARGAELFRQWIAHGLVPAPSADEPWFPQWGVLPAAGLIGVLAASFAMKPSAQRQASAAREALVIVALMLAAWIFATHLKSRFLLPSVVPLAVGCALLVHTLARFASAAGETCAVLLALSAAALSLGLYAREPDKPLPLGAGRLHAPSLAIDVLPQLTGEAIARALETATDAERRQLLSTVTTPLAMNVLLPGEARVVGIGFATPFYILRPMQCSTVWDRGDFDRVAAEHPGTPRAWGAALRSRGYTHALVDPTMLERWMRDGWLNPELASGTWLQPFIESNRLILRTSEDRLLVELLPQAP